MRRTSKGLKEAAGSKIQCQIKDIWSIMRGKGKEHNGTRMQCISSGAFENQLKYKKENALNHWKWKKARWVPDLMEEMQDSGKLFKVVIKQTQTEILAANTEKGSWEKL